MSDWLSVGDLIERDRKLETLSFAEKRSATELPLEPVAFGDPYGLTPAEKRSYWSGEWCG